MAVHRKLLVSEFNFLGEKDGLNLRKGVKPDQVIDKITECQVKLKLQVNKCSV